MLPFEIENKRQNIQDEVEKLGAELVEILFRRSGGRSVVTILADKTGGITLDDCAAINHRLSPLFDELVEGSYFLEVNSPGLDRPMRSEKDFLRAVGGRVRLVCRGENGGTSVYVGKLVSAKDNQVEVQLDKDGSSLKLPIESMVKAVREIKIKG